MKHICHTLTIILLVESLHAATNGMAVGHAAAIQTERIKDAGLDLPVYYEDQAMPDATKAAIISDYLHTLGNLKAHGKAPVLRPQGGSIAGKNVMRFHAVTLKGAHKKLPDGFEADFGLVAETEDGSEYLVIPKRLSDAYQSALALKSKEAQAFERLDGFIQFMNSLQTSDLPAVTNLLYLGEGAERYRAELVGRSPAEFREDYGGSRYRAPSLLDVVRGTGEMSGHLVAKMTVLNAAGDIEGELPLIYDVSRWKILITVPDI